MIPEDMRAPTEDTRITSHYSRRGFLRLLAAGCVAGGFVGSGLAGCASTSVKRSGPTPQPTPLVPSGRISPENAARITRLATFEPRDGLARAVAWSPDSRIVASGGYHDVCLWDVATGTLRARLTGHTNQVYSLAWSAPSALLASASSDGTIRLWDARQSQAVQTLHSAPSIPLFSVCWSPDGKRIAAGTEDGNILLWDVQTGKRTATWEGPSQRVSKGGRFPFAAWGVSWSPDGRRIVSTRYDDYVLIWDVATGHNQVIPKTDTQPNTAAWAPDGRQFAITDDRGRVILWDAATTRRDASFQSHDEAGWSYGLAWSPDGAMIASSRQSGLLQVWDARTGKELAAIQGHINAVWGLAWSPDGLLIASVSDDETVHLWGVR